jgi:hypothetical protein
MSDNKISREVWLGRAAVKLASRIKRAGYEMPENCRYACGFPSKGGLAKKKRVIGQCWAADCSKDKTFEILVSPTQADAVEVLAILLHEMIHAAVGIEEGHKGHFRKCARAVGLEGKLTATVPGDDLRADLKMIAGQIGPYPHAKLEGRLNTGPKKQTARMIKCECICGYVIRTTRKWIETGLPTCHCGEAFTTDYEPEEEDDG